MKEHFYCDIPAEYLRRSVPEFIHNKAPKPFAWTAKANDVLQKIIRTNQVLSYKKSMLD